MEFSKTLGRRKSDGGSEFLVDLLIIKKKLPPQKQSKSMRKIQRKFEGHFDTQYNFC